MYVRKTWKDYPSLDTPILAEGLNNIEQGVESAHEALEEIQERFDTISDIVYPIGSVYISINQTNPSVLFGGTWEKFGLGQTLVCVNPEDEDFKECELTGGEKEKNLSVENLPKHTHSYTAKGSVTIRERVWEILSSHKHHYYKPKRVSGYGNVIKSGSMGFTGELEQVLTGSPNMGLSSEDEENKVIFSGIKTETEVSGQGKAYSNMPPYITCIFWKRTK